MICFNCGYQLNSADAEQCKVCGAKFPIKCNTCSTPNPMLAKYCLNCGNDLNNLLVNNLAENKLEENRKNVAVIFADVSGFTSLSEKLDPEEVREIINDCFQYITKPVYELEGTIDKYIGDCVMVLFGAKKTHNDDANRAVNCAIQMLKRIEDFSRERLTKNGILLDLSIGVSYGLVVTGVVGNYYDKDYTVMGDVVNTSQRLQTAAESGRILVSQKVFEETDEYVHYSLKKEIRVKNKENLVECYTPISLITKTEVENKFLISRENELAIMNEAYLSKDKTNYVRVIGESGLGKTTLVKQFTGNLGNDARKIWINSNISYKERPYNTLSEIITNILNINPDDTNRIKRNRLISFIDYILRNYSGEEIIRSYNFLALIMGLERDNDYIDIINSMEYTDLEREIKRQVSLFFENLDKKQNFIVVIDDMHLSDKGSIEILLNLKKTNCFFVFISQYVIAAFDDSTKTNYMIKLDRFNKEETAALISLKMKEANIDEYFTENIFSITNGNPMFINEIIYTIQKKSSFYKKDDTLYINNEILSELPKTLENTILNNISDLDEYAIKLLRIASVIGIDFNLSWVSALFDGAFDEIRALKLPLKLNIIGFRKIQKNLGSTDKIYSFTQDAIRMVIYESMLNSDKKNYHENIAKLIEKMHDKELENYYEILGFHYQKANLSRVAKEYFFKAAEKMKHNSIFNSALEYYDKYIAIEKISGDAADNIKLVSCLISKCDIFINISSYDKALETILDAEKLAIQGENINNIKLLKVKTFKETARYEEALAILDELEPQLSKSSNLFGKALQLKCGIYIILGKSEIIELVKKSEEILLKSRDYASLSETMSQAGIKYFFGGNLVEAIHYFQKAYEYAEKSNTQGIMAKISINLGIIYHASGEIDKSFVYLNSAMEISKKISDIKNYLIAEINLGIFNMEKGLFEKAKPLFDDAIIKAKDVNLLYQTCLSLANKADVEYELANYAAANRLYKDSLEIAIQHNMTVEQGLNYLGISKTDMVLEFKENILENLTKVHKIFEDSDEDYYFSDYYFYLSSYYFKLEEFDRALNIIDSAIDSAHKSNNDLKEIQSLRKKGDILISLNRLDEAMEQYDSSIKLALEIESEYELAKAYFSRYKLCKQQMQLTVAKEDLLKAKEMILKIDDCRWTNEIIGEEV
jgi:class 3 adenylate cyclase/tetratricopeptide (TPR) repeat protein/energy-coupling factor transporter ATP-binding protein EcfA2